MDNQVYCVGVAPALNKEASYHSFGHSIITNPWGEVIAEAGTEEEIIFGEIDLNEIKRVREEHLDTEDIEDYKYEIIKK